MENTTVTVIGGADGPTSVFLSGGPLPLVMAGIVVAALIAVVIIRLRKKKK